MKSEANSFRLLPNGSAFFAAARDAIQSAAKSIRLESYIFANDAIGQEFLRALIAAARRGVRVRVLVDDWGSLELDRGFFEPLRAAGGEARRFNPLSLRRFAFRDHRKLLACDDREAFVGGFNFSADYSGDGRTTGWCDLGVAIQGGAVAELARSFDAMFERAGLPHPWFARLRRTAAKSDLRERCCQWLFSGPGRGRNPLKTWIRHDLARAADVVIVAAYFLPPLRMRRALIQAARSGRRVRLIFGARSDVPLSRAATRSLYARLLRAGVEIWEYQPQILHAKLMIADEVVYTGSSNLDPRSLEFNYELTLRTRRRELAVAARDWVSDRLPDSRRIELKQWIASRSAWDRFRDRAAWWIATNVDHFISRRQLRGLR